MHRSDSIEVSQNTNIFREASHIIKQAIGKVTIIGALMVTPVMIHEASLSADQASATETAYPDGDATDCSAKYGKYSWCKNGKDISTRGFGYRNCTDWAAFRIQQLTGVAVPYGQNMGHGGQWDDMAPSHGFTVDNTPEPGDAAIWDPMSDTFGHVAVVESMNVDGTVNISEFNRMGDGKYGTRNKIRAQHYVDFNGAGKGINGQSTGGGSSGPRGRLGLINSVNAAYAKEEITEGGWNRIAGNGDAHYISASDTHVAIVNGAGEAWGGDIDPAKLKAGSPGFVPLYVPRDPSHSGGVKKIETDKDGNMIAITNCNSAWGLRNKPGGNRWVPMTNCGDALDVDVGSGQFGLINGCGGAYISNVEYAWTPALNCGDAKDIEISESAKIAVINSSNTAYVYDAPRERWINKTPVGDARKVAIGRDRLMVITSSGAAWAADLGPDITKPMTQLTAHGDAKDISVGADDRMGLINSGGAAFASDTITPGGKWTRESANGDAKKFVVG